MTYAYYSQRLFDFCTGVNVAVYLLYTLTNCHTILDFINSITMFYIDPFWFSLSKHLPKIVRVLLSIVNLLIICTDIQTLCENGKSAKIQRYVLFLPCRKNTVFALFFDGIVYCFIDEIINWLYFDFEKKYIHIDEDWVFLTKYPQINHVPEEYKDLELNCTNNECIITILPGDFIPPYRILRSEELDENEIYD